MKTNKNIKLAYLLIFLNRSLFWYPVWLLYMLKYINIEQATIVQAIGLGTSIITEIPTGAVSDLLGKKRTLFVAFLFTSIGEFLMGFSTNFIMFALVYVIINIGYSFYSGTMDAFIYDTLVSGKREGEYPKVISHKNSIGSLAIVISTLSGMFLYKVLPGLPFIFTGIAKFIGMITVLFTNEPEVDTDHFSIKNFFSQTAKGFGQLFNKRLLQSTLLLITYGAFFTIASEIVDDSMIISFGYDEIGIGTLYTVMIFIGIFTGMLYQKVSKKVKPIFLVAIGILILASNFIFAPLISTQLWTGFFIFRVIYSPLKEGAIIDLINTNTPSKIRATTISTYELIRKIPYVLFSAQIGFLMNSLGIKQFGQWFSIVLLVIAIPQIVLLLVRQKRPETKVDMV